MGFFRIFWKRNIQEAYLPKTSIVKQIVSEILAFSALMTPYKMFRPKSNLEGFVWSHQSITGLIRPQNANFWQVSVLDVLSEYLDKSHKFTYFIFMTSSL